MQAGGRLGQHGQVAAGHHRQGDQRHVQVQHVARARVAGQALVTMGGGLGHRLGQVDDQPKVLVLLYSGVAKHLAHVQHAQAAHFQQVLQQFRAGAVEHVGGDLGELGGVVGHQAVTAAEQFQGQLALA
ncbi:hypothetical protein D3C73_832160 [compost metagenome]